MALERRSASLEVAAKGRRLEGYAAVFGAEARIGSFVETIRRGAFSASLKDARDVVALVDHDAGRVLGRTRSGTLRLSEDTRGLAFSVDLPETQAARDLLALAERGDIGGASFAFTVAKDGEHWTGDRRELRAVTLHEISVVQSWPAYAETSVHARSRQARSMSPALASLWLEALRP
jgi:HK97 family phage prohead protease